MRRQWVDGLLVVLALSVAGCAQESSDAQPRRARCELCGMVVDAASGWRAGAQAEGGATLSFDTPKCLFRYRHERGAVRAPWVIEYYSQERRPAEGLFYVLGSDLEGPMGRDLVPVATRERAEQLREDHHGQRVLAYAEVSAEIAAALFRPRP